MNQTKAAVFIAAKSLDRTTIGRQFRHFFGWGHDLEEQLKPESWLRSMMETVELSQRHGIAGAQGWAEVAKNSATELRLTIDHRSQELELLIREERHPERCR